MIKVRWNGPCMDSSGYAAATRTWLSALIDHTELDLTIRVASFEQIKTPHVNFEQKTKHFIERSLQPNINIVHLTPENYPTFRQTNCYNIACTVWETEQLPKEWTALCNSMDEVWVPSEWNKEIFINSGITKPVYVIPHIIKEQSLDNVIPLNVGTDDTTFIFYSIFQWIARKNPIALLQAYLTEFESHENVCLVLKTYRMNSSQEEQSLIKQDIMSIKKGLNLESYPQMRFFGGLFSEKQMLSLHKRGDCFVLPHKGEGFGIPIAEAMLFGKPVIATNYSANVEFMNTENSYLINSRRTPVAGMIFGKYTGKMIWGDPDILHLRTLMRCVYNHRNEAIEKGIKAKEFIKDHFNEITIANKIVNRLKAIQGVK